MAILKRNSSAENTSLKILKVRPENINRSLQKMLEYYINGQLILIEDFRLPFNLSVFNFKSLPKFKADTENHTTKEILALTQSMKKPYAWRSAKNIHKDIDKANQLFIVMRQCEEYVKKNIFMKMFNDKGMNLQSGSSWRFTETGCEDYHFDTYQDTLFRAFWNLSDSSRTWGIGHRSSDILKMYKDEVCKFIHESEKNDIALNQVNINTFFTKLIANEDNHLIDFCKYDMWICDSTKVAHQINGGDKLAAFTYGLGMGSTIKKSIWKKLKYPIYMKDKFDRLCMTSL